jgi:RNA polymerase-binding transcription factor DksA
MKTSLEASAPAGHTAQPSHSTLQTNRFRAALLVSREEQSAGFARHEDTLARLTANSSDDTTALDRALAALRMYVAAESIEDIQDALLRIRNCEYGTCQSCGQPLSPTRLEAFPWARCCTACSPASSLATRAEKYPVPDHA